MSIDLSTFWTTWNVASGDTSSTNQYDFWRGIIMDDDTQLSSQYDFFTYHNTTRYEFFKNLNSTYPEVWDETTFYQNTNDARIYDFNSFYTYAAETLPGGGPAPVTSVGLLGAWDGFSEEIPMSSIDDMNWELLSYQMPEGSGSYASYFRVNNTDDWGGNGFPIGNAAFGGASIPAVFGEYNIYFNSTTGDYEFDSLAPALPYLFSVGNITPNCDTVTGQTLYTQSSYLYDGLVLYSDSGRTEVFVGNASLSYTHIEESGFNYESMNISSEGVISNLVICSHPYIFSDGSIFADCNAVSAQTLYAAYTPPQNDRTMYTDSALTTAFDGGNSYYTYLADNGDPIATMIITETGTITTYTVCEAPTPTPTPTPSVPMNASGGTITTYTSGGTTYRVHTFTSNGTFTVNSLGSSSGNIDVLLVGAGGKGGDTYGAGGTAREFSAGGGGAGGAIYTSTTVSTTTYNLSIGTTNGANTSGFTLTAFGGGNGAFFNNVSLVAATNGGSGGGGVGNGGDTGTFPGTGVSGQGFNGGQGFVGDNNRGSGGGGGASAVGQNGQLSGPSGNGGAGIQSNITGTLLFYAGGGGAGRSQFTDAGLGGSSVGGNGGTTSGANGSNATFYGGGGGGAGEFDSFGEQAVGGNGYQGVVIIRYPI